MELSGHPSEDLVAELLERGAQMVPGGPAGPDPMPGTGPDAGQAAAVAAASGSWLWVPDTLFETGIDDMR